MKMKTIKLAAALGLAIAALPLSSRAYAFQSSDKWATWTSGSYIVANDVWGSNPGPETIWANSGSNWGVITTQYGPGIQSYPHVEYNSINSAVNSLGTITSSFNATTPGGCSYDMSYDIWLNGSGYEVMIWNSWSGNQPVAQSYNAQGQANPTYSNVNIDGVTYNVFTGTGGAGPCMSFLRTSQTSSGTVNLTDILKWINSTGWYNNPTLTSIQCGWEILNTGGVQMNFTMNSYSVSVSSGGGSATPITPYLQVNGGAWQQTASVSVSVGDTLTFGPQPVSGGSWSWSGPAGFSSTSRQVSVNNIQTSQAGTYTATYINSSGVSSSQNFSVTVSGSSGGGGSGNLIANGTYTLLNVNSGLALDVPGWSTANGVQIDQWANNGGNNQKWQLTNLGNNVVELVNVNSGKALEVAGGSTANGATVDQWTYGGGANQQWTVISVGSGAYELANKNSGQALDVSGANTGNGGLLLQWPYSGGANQKWTFH